MFSVRVSQLWYFEAIRAYYTATEDLSLLQALYPTLEGIISYHCTGTRFGIQQDSDGLLRAGKEDLALTWMDAKTDIVHTPRIGKPVELSALWANALMAMSSFAFELGHDERSKYYIDMGNKTERSFRKRFWNPARGFCFDVIDGGMSGDETDDRLRPNQLIAASLNWSPMTAEQRYGVVEACSTHLLTSYGIRTLAVDEPGYSGKYQGDVNSRDSAYHQGTAWPFLLGPFVLAHLRVFGDRKAARGFLLPLLRSHLNISGVGQVSEIFDGDSPHCCHGTIAQAWSVAEVLRAWIATEPDSSEEQEERLRG